MKIISVVNQKGGCGKTITAVNLSAGLSRKKNNVLLIDLDPQAHATFSLKKETAFTITDILEKYHKKENISLEKFTVPVSDNFHFISSSIGLAALEHKLNGENDKLNLLANLLKTIELNFDYCLLDCPPNLGILTLNAIQASQYSLIPIGICDFSLNGLETLKSIFSMVKDFKGSTPTPLYLLSQLDSRSKFSREFLKRVKTRLGESLLTTAIRTNIYLREAAACGEDIFKYMPSSRGAQDFAALTEEIELATCKKKWKHLYLKGNNFEEVYVVGNFNRWEKNEQYKLRKVAKDIWIINLPLEKGEYRYKFIAANKWFCDPHNQLTENDSFGGKNSILRIE